jgi:hypothetical protein
VLLIDAVNEVARERAVSFLRPEPNHYHLLVYVLDSEFSFSVMQPFVTGLHQGHQQGARIASARCFRDASRAF